MGGILLALAARGSGHKLRAVIEYRPANGGGSCAHCLGSLNLDAVKQDGTWYCCTSCAEGRDPDRSAAVAEPKLYNRPTRYFKRRTPKELRGS
jgi:Prokaryotic metallothionein